MTPTNLTMETSGLGKVISNIATITTELPYGGLGVNWLIITLLSTDSFVKVYTLGK